MLTTFGERLKSARIAQKLTQKQLALRIDAKHNSISDWENNKNKPDPDTIELLCGVLNISPNYLLGSNTDDTLSLDEKDLISKYRLLDPHGIKIVNIVLDEEYTRSISIKELAEDTVDKLEIVASIPYAYDLAASAGLGEYAMDIAHFETVGLSETPPRSADFLIRVDGDSMEPKYSHNDKVYIKRQDAVNEGEIGLFYLDGNVYIKKQGYDELISLNPEYTPIPVAEYSTSKCFGKVLGKCNCDIIEL